MNIPEYVSLIIEKLLSAHFEAYTVGGCVRDTLLGNTPSDWDITTSASPSEMLSLFGPSAKPTGLIHGTVTVTVSGGSCEVTSFRTEGLYSDHRRPDSVKFCRNLREDLSRRDFTVNAMAYSPVSGLTDLFGGRKDLNLKLIRAIGEPGKRFNEDALRILRAYRFCSALGFTLEPETARAADILSASLRFVSAERKYSEITKLIMGKNSAYALKSGFSAINPILPLDENAIQISNSMPHDLSIRLSKLIAPSADSNTVLSALKAPKSVIKEVNILRTVKPDTSDARIRRLIRAYGPELSSKLVPAERVQKLRMSCCTLKDLAVNGSVIRKLGYEGREIGESLEFLLEEVVSGRLVNTPEALTAALRARKD